MRTHVFSFQCASIAPHARGFLALAMGFRPVAKVRLSMTHWEPLKKNKAKFFLGLALKTCIEGNCTEKARFIAIKPVKSRVYGGCKNFHQFSQNKCLVRGMTLISRSHQFFKWNPPSSPVISTLLAVIHLPKHYVIPRHQMKKPCEPQ